MSNSRLEAIDQALVQLLDERAALISASDLAQDNQTLRRVAAMPRKAMRLGLIVRLWREVMAEDRARLSPTYLSVWGDKDAPRTLELARHRFGAAPPVTMVAKAEDALAAARMPGGIGVLALSSEHPWWLRLLAEPKLQVFAALPDLASAGPLTALAVAQTQVEPTGDDQTFWVTDSAMPSNAIAAALAQDGVAGDLVCQVGSFCLFSLAGFYQADDQRLARAPGALSGVIGASPAVIYV